MLPRARVVLTQGHRAPGGLQARPVGTTQLLVAQVLATDEQLRDEQRLAFEPSPPKVLIAWFTDWSSCRERLSMSILPSPAAPCLPVAPPLLAAAAPPAIPASTLKSPKPVWCWRIPTFVVGCPLFSGLGFWAFSGCFWELPV